MKKLSRVILAFTVSCNMALSAAPGSLQRLCVEKMLPQVRGVDIDDPVRYDDPHFPREVKIMAAKIIRKEIRPEVFWSSGRISLNREVREFRFSEDGNFFIILFQNNGLLGVVRGSWGNRRCRNFKLSPDGNTLVVKFATGGTELYTRRALQWIQEDAPWEERQTRTCIFSPNSNVMVVNFINDTCALFHKEAGVWVEQPLAYHNRLQGITFGPDSRTLIVKIANYAGGPDLHIIYERGAEDIWTPVTKGTLWRAREIENCIFSHEGILLVKFGSGPSGMYCKREGGNWETLEIPWGNRQIDSAGFSDDGNSLAVSFRDEEGNGFKVYSKSKTGNWVLLDEHNTEDTLGVLWGAKDDLLAVGGKLYQKGVAGKWNLVRLCGDHAKVIAIAKDGRVVIKDGANTWLYYRYDEKILEADLSMLYVDAVDRVRQEVEYMKRELELKVSRAQELADRQQRVFLAAEARPLIAAQAAARAREIMEEREQRRREEEEGRIQRELLMQRDPEFRSKRRTTHRERGTFQHS